METPVGASARSASREDREEVTSVNESKDLLTTTQKARTINFDVPLYGTYAEIGAGQEVAREFFHAGGASGTIAADTVATLQLKEAIMRRSTRSSSRNREHRYRRLLSKDR
jgi:hypothetical protein